MGVEKEEVKAILFAGAPIDDYSAVLPYLQGANCVACADSGLRHAYHLGLKVDLAIGDFDSFDGDIAAAEVVKLPVHKDDTDCMALARILIQRGYDEVVLLGCLGARIDHTLGALSVMLHLHRSSINVIAADGKHTVRIVSDGGSVSFSPRRDGYFSVIPFGCSVACGVCIDGGEYPLRDAMLSADFPLGVSNRAVADKLTVSVGEGTLLVIESRD